MDAQMTHNTDSAAIFAANMWARNMGAVSAEYHAQQQRSIATQSYLDDLRYNLMREARRLESRRA